MKFKNIIVFSFSLLLLGFSSCNYLDIVPDDKPTLEDAFKNENEAQKALHGLYAAIPDFFFFQDSPIFVGTDELITSKPGATQWYAYKSIIYEEYSVNNPWFNYWSNKSARHTYDFYASIRKCYQFLNNLEKVPNLSEHNRKVWTGEAQFLIAYYHTMLMQFYGPVVLVDQEYPTDLPEDELLVTRSTYDESVDFVVSLLDRAAENLPARVELQDYGKVTRVVAKSLKSRLLLYAASPLFNGNSEFYSNFTNPDGTHLISQDYDAEKWNRARTAALEAIQDAEAQGAKLFNKIDAPGASAFDRAVNDYRYAFVEKFNSEVIWGLTPSGGVGHNQRYMIPKVTSSGNARPLGNVAPTMTLVSQYYTKNGLPLDVDPSTKNKDLWVYSAENNTALVNLDREPRFYASIGYDGGKYDFGGMSIMIDAMAGQPQGYEAGLEYYSSSGYFSKKWVHPSTSYNAATNQFNYVRYAFPEFRLAELYLNFIEADFEYKKQLSGEAEAYWNQIRKRAGIPTLAESWSIVGGKPVGDQLREAIHKERSIELSMETKRFFDLRRWKKAHIELTKTQYAWNVYGKTKDEFYQRVQMDESGKRGFTSPRNYLHPIHIQDINTNKNLTQNPGW